VHTLLLADDSVTIQRVIELTFADEDVQVVAVSDGDQAIVRLESGPVDIVLADIGMPGRNGYEVAQYIRQSPALAHIPVVLLTGAFEPVDQERAAAAGCDGVLAKPFEPQMVIGRVRELLAQPRRVSPTRDTDLALPSADQTVSAPAPEAAPAGELNDYFDRLDAAFANLASPAASGVAPAPAAAPADAAIDWYGTKESSAPVNEHWDLPVQPTEAPEAAAAPEPAPAPASAFEAPAPVAAAAPLPSLPPRPAALPTLAEAFAVILEAERGASSSAAPAWPSITAAAPVIGDDVVEDVTKRVLDRLSDQIARDQIAAIVTQVAERMVAAEIERIKASVA
jgi:CheY-like chemotaxis protein